MCIQAGQPGVVVGLQDHWSEENKRVSHSMPGISLTALLTCPLLHWLVCFSVARLWLLSHLFLLSPPSPLIWLYLHPGTSSPPPLDSLSFSTPPPSFIFRLLLPPHHFHQTPSLTDSPPVRNIVTAESLSLLPAPFPPQIDTEISLHLCLRTSAQWGSWLLSQSEVTNLWS